MTRSPQRVAAALALTAPLCLLLSCAFLYPEPGNEGEQESFTSESADYLKNAKEYFSSARYGRARDQLNKLLEREPGNWMARIHAAYCDYFLGIQRLGQADLDGGRSLFSRGEAELRRVWNGEIERSTADVRLAKVQQWKAAMGVAMCQRGLGWADELEAEQRERYRKNLKRDDPERYTVTKEIGGLRARRDKNYEASRTLFQRLADMEYASPEAIKNLGELQLIMGDEDAAEKQFLRYLAIADASYETNKALESEGTLDEVYKSERDRRIAGEFLKQKLDSNSKKRVEVLIFLGRVRFIKNDAQKSLEYLERAQQIQPERLDILLKKAQCFGESQRYAEAVAELDTYLARRSEREDPFDQEIFEAYRLKARYERQMKRGGR